MDEWFKFHTNWFNGLKRLRPDPAAAGRFILALMDFYENGTETELPGKEDMLLVMAMADLRTDNAQREKKQAEQQSKAEKISEARSKAAKSRRQGSEAQDEDFSVPADPANADNCMQTQTNADNCMQTDANACKQPHKKEEIRDKNEDIREKKKEKEIRFKETGAGGALKESQPKKPESRQAGRSQTGCLAAQKTVTEARYDQRENTEPGMDSIPRWLTDLWNRKAAGLPLPSWAAGSKGGWSV